MSNKSKIEWTDRVWSPVTGCTPVSPGCDNCYAARMAHRFAGHGGWPADEPFAPTMHESRLAQPLRWKKPSKICVCPQGDLFHEDIPTGFIDRVFGVMLASYCHTGHENRHRFQILTKRPRRMMEYLTNHEPTKMLRFWDEAFSLWCHGGDDVPAREFLKWDYSKGVNDRLFPLPNVWLGVTAENQEMADLRVPLLSKCPAVIRFVSVEPMLGPVKLLWWKNIDWVICGGESGPKARPMHPYWATALKDECELANIPFFFKQWGEWLPWGHKDYCEDGSGRPRPGKNVKTYKWYNSWRKSYRIGKKAAGRLLGGEQYDQFPREAGR